jgi:hypothetical protein
MINIEEKNTRPQCVKIEVTVGFQQATCLCNSFLQVQSQIKRDYFQLQMQWQVVLRKCLWSCSNKQSATFN